MHKQIIAICSNKNYWNHCKYLVANIRDIGKYTGEIIVITPDIQEDLVTSIGCTLFRCPLQDIALYYKYHIFNSKFPDSEQLLYLDCDCLVQHNLNDFFKKYNNSSLYVDFEPFSIEQTLHCFDPGRYHESTDNLILEFNKDTSVKEIGFNSGIMLFNKPIMKKMNLNITDDILLEKTEQFKKINFHCRNGSDQPIFNNVFRTYAAKCDDMHFWRDVGMEESTIVHFCHEDAPWHNNDYSKTLGTTYLDYYRKMMNNL